MPPKKYRHGQTAFQDRWLLDPELSPWILKVPNDIYSARCRFCTAATISLSSMGRQALVSHMKGIKHMKALKSLSSTSVVSFLHRRPVPVLNPPTKPVFEVSSQPGPSSSSLQPTPSSFHVCPSLTSTTEPTTSLPETGLKKYLLGDSVTKAEIIWAIHCVMTHSSFRSAASGIEVMKLMFTDSKIASKLELQRTKLSYLLIFGISPYFQQSLINLVKDCPSFVVLFDESFNKVSSKQQMDISIRFWNVEKEETSTRYLTSVFLHSGEAQDLQKALISSIDCLDINNLLQVSMDGPNVNLRLLKDLKVFLAEQGSDKQIVDFGSCGLHTAHNAFKSGIVATGWPIVSFLRACYNYFKGSPARRGNFIRITSSEIFPKKFCAVRWVENVEVAQTALNILPKLKMYVESVGKTKEEKSPSFKIMTDCLQDPLLAPKIAFFKTLASDAEPFLREFQTDWPYIPFLHGALLSMHNNVLKRFVKSDKIKTSVDLGNEENLLPIKKIDLGFSTKSEIGKSKAKDLDIAVLHKEARCGLKAFVIKLETRSPLKYQITRNFASLDPKIAIKTEGEERLDKLIEEFVKLNWISGTKGDKVSRQFKNLVQTDGFKKSANEFRRTKDRVDHFWVKEIKNADSERFLDLRDFLERVLILSHGNASVERGFSINKECLVENLKEKSLIGLRTVYDAVNAEGGVQKLIITKSLIHAARNSNAKYKEYLKEARQEMNDAKKVQEEMKRKRKLLLDLKNKKAKVIEDAQKEAESLDKMIVDLSKQI